MLKGGYPEKLLEQYKNGNSNNSAAPYAADKLAAMRPEKPLPGRIITHSDHSSEVYTGRDTSGRAFTTFTKQSDSE